MSLPLLLPASPLPLSSILLSFLSDVNGDAELAGDSASNGSKCDVTNSMLENFLPCTVMPGRLHEILH